MEGIILALGAIFVFVSLYLSVWIVKEKEVVIMERLGRYSDTLTAGVHFVVPWIDWPKRYTFRTSHLCVTLFCLRAHPHFRPLILVLSPAANIQGTTSRPRKGVRARSRK